MQPVQSIRLAVVAAVLIVCAYANSLHNDFHFDDTHVIVNNVYIRSLQNIPLFFTDAHTFSSLPQNATYRPLVTLSFAIDYAAGSGLDPVPFHITQIALLIVVWALLIAFYTGVLGNRLVALAAATLFAVHTANTETMNFISSRSELISAIGVVAAFLLVQRSAVARRYHLYLMPLALGALAKAPVVVFAPLLMVYVYFFSDEPRSWGRAFRAALPSLVTGIALLLFLNSMNVKEWSSGGGSKLDYALTQPFVWLHYVRLFFLPVGLTADTDWRLFEHWYDTRAIIGFVFVLALVAGIHRLSRTHELRPIAFGLAWFAIALIPTSSFFPLAEVANEHRIFFPYIGLALAVVHAASLLTRRVPVVAAIGIVLILIAHVIGTRARNETWRTEESLWRDTAEKSPGNGRALMNYGLTQMAQGRHAVAKSYFERALVLNPNYSTLHINLGIVDGNEEHFRTAIRLKDDVDGHYFYGRWLAQNGRGPEAVAHLTRAQTLAPGAANVRSLMTQLDAARGGQYESGAHNDYAGWFNYGAQQTRNGNDLEAAIAYRQALKFDSRSADALNNLGWSLARVGFRTEARDALTRALTIRPDYELARNNLRWVESMK